MKRFLPTVAVMVGMMTMMGVAEEAHAAPARQTPYWASISEGEARMRVGPSLDFPSSWLYRRRDLPVKVVKVLGLWRQIEDWEGTQGWMHVRLLSDTRTAIVTAPEARMRQAANDGARVAFRAQKGVVGRLTGCSAGWCGFDVQGQRGYVRVNEIWGGIN